MAYQPEGEQVLKTHYKQPSYDAEALNIRQR